MNKNENKVLIPFVFLVVAAFLGCSKLNQDPKATLTREIISKRDLDI